MPTTNISDYFRLDKGQYQLDFVNVYVNDDIPLFIDPSAFKKYDDEWCSSCHNDIVDFFQLLVDLIRHGKRNDSMRMLNFLSEPKETHLGVGDSCYSGRGVSGIQAGDLYKKLAESRAVQTGFVTDLAECELLVRGIGYDKISDITTNIIRGHLIKYTQDQCKLHNIPMFNLPSGFIWNKEHKVWRNFYTDLPAVNGKKLILVPKKIVVSKPDINAVDFYNNEILEYLQTEHLNASSALVETLKNGKLRVTKKSLMEQEEYKYSKDFIYTFCDRHPEILANYKRKKQESQQRNLNKADIHLSEITEKELAFHLIDTLNGIPTGSHSASSFHNYCVGALEFIFYPTLNNPKKEHEIHQGRKRIDIVFNNNAPGGFFFEMRTNPNTRSSLIMIECKNYSSDPSNPELDQLSGRFSIAKGWFGLLVARKFENKDGFIQRCRDTVNDGRGYIIPLDDDDIKMMLRFIYDKNRLKIENYLRDIYTKIIS